MPVGNELFRTRLPARNIEETEFCRKCGYDLKGLTSDDRCPECGAAIKTIRSKRKLGETITDAPAAYLNFLVMATWTAAITFVVTIAAYIATEVLEDIAEIRLVWAASCLFWIFAVFMLTADRQSLITPRHELQKEWRISRWIARLSQFAWVAMALLAFWETTLLIKANPGLIQVVGPRFPNVPQSVEILRIFKFAMLLIGMTGIGFLCLHLATLASWARDDRLETRLRTCTYFLCGGVPLYAFGFAVREVFGWVGFLGYGMALVMGALVMIAWCIFLISLWQLGTLCTWALASAAAEQARDARLVARAEEERAKAIDREFAAPPPVDLRPSGEIPAPPIKPKGPYIERPQSVEGYEVKDS